MNPLALRLLLWGGLIASAALLLWGIHDHIWRQGYAKAAAECKAADQSARIAQLERELAQSLTAESIGQQTRTVVQERVTAINVEVSESVEIIRAGWDRPACVLPDRVREELQTGIDAANAAASRL